jgi:Fur family transcriptional regulator, ferric uptake regulator
MNWTEHALSVVRDSGLKPGRARAAVIEVLGAQTCCLAVLEIHDLIREQRSRVGIASVYRALETLTELGLVHRLELGSGGAYYEPAAPTGDHHHHLVCDSCGRVEAFSDERLERAIGDVSGGSGFQVAGHDIVLRGSCESCAA